MLDVGCGSGELALQAARLVGPTGSVVGADISAPLIADAQERAERAGVANARFVEADVQVHDLPASSYDVVLSRFGVMFFDDPVEAFANLRQATARQLLRGEVGHVGHDGHPRSSQVLLDRALDRAHRQHAWRPGPRGSAEVPRAAGSFGSGRDLAPS